VAARRAGGHLRDRHAPMHAPPSLAPDDRAR
jgi:hypothetical protein